MVYVYCKKCRHKENGVTTLVEGFCRNVPVLLLILTVGSFRAIRIEVGLIPSVTLADVTRTGVLHILVTVEISFSVSQES